MTVDQPPQGSNLPANPGDYQGSTGLEDFDTSDAIIPRLSINHREATFKDNLTGQVFDELTLVILGLTKQRILWYHIVDEGKNEQPMCKSPDFHTGYPDQDPPRGKEFPWEKSGFNPNDFPLTPTAQQELPCANCQLKEWGTHPNGNNPYCAEQWTLSVQYDPDGSGSLIPAFLTLQKSGLKPIRSYLTSFARSNRPAFTQMCRVTLTARHRGQVDYAVPNFIGIGESDRNAWPEFSRNYDEMRAYLTAAPVAFDEDSAPTPAPGSDNSWGTQPAQQQQPPQQQQQPPSNTSSQPVNEPPQQSPTPPQPTPPQQQQQTQPVQPSPPSQTTTVPQGATESSSDLPF